MAENDIYNGKWEYNHIKDNLNLLLIPPEKRTGMDVRKTKYYCRNEKNIQYFGKEKTIKPTP